MRQIILAAGAFAALMGHTPAQADTVILRPSSQWNVDFGENRCRLARLFTDGSNDHLLYFEQHWPANGSGVTVAGQLFKRFQNRTNTALSTADNRPPLETQPYKGEVERFGETLIYSSLNLGRGETNSDQPSSDGALPQLDTTFADTIDYLSFKQRSREVRFDTGPLGDAFKVLNQCTTGLIEEWGLNGEEHRTALRLPRWINQTEIARKIGANYPQSAANRGEQGIMRMRVIVDVTGGVEDCVVIKATTTEKLESPACNAMEQARFEPGLDAGGKPMRSYYATTVTYRMN